MLFKMLDRQAWKESGHNPDKMLRELPRELLEKAGTDADYIGALADIPTLQAKLADDPALVVGLNIDQSVPFEIAAEEMTDAEILFRIQKWMQEDKLGFLVRAVERNLALPEVADLRNVVEGAPSPDGEGVLSLARGVEVGHIFQLGTKYSQAMNAVVLGEDGKSHVMPMGCYGIGVSRIVAAAIEQNHDEHGICWPAPLAPFQVAILPMNAKKSHRVREAADALYAGLVEAGVEVLLDDRNIRPGVMFNDMELIGIPHRVVVGERGLDDGVLEYRRRTSSENESLPLEGAVGALLEKLAAG